MNTITRHLTSLPPSVAVYEGKPPSDAVGPMVCVYDGPPAPWNRRYGHTARTRRQLWRIVCVGNTPLGAATLAGLVVTAVDGMPGEASLITVRNVSDPVEDTTDPSQWRWSSTVEAVHFT